MSRHVLIIAVAAIASFGDLKVVLSALTDSVLDRSRVVYLHAGRDFGIFDGRKRRHLPLLGRELARQALLVAAREELSCATYDVHLGHKIPKTGCIELDLFGVAGETSRLVLLKKSLTEVEAIGMEDFKTANEVRISHLVGNFERLSRSEMVTYLREAGVTGDARPWVERAAVPSEVTGLMQDMNFVSQWDAACRLHSEIKLRGASPDLISALSMAYANLGLLTEYHWNTAHNVFTARSLIYAQRLVTSNRSPQQALLTRAYCYALAGAFPAAINDINSFNQSWPREPAVADSQLGLIDLLNTYCHFTFDDLKPQNYESSIFQLACLLQFLAYDFARFEEDRESIGLEATREMPHCYRIVSSLAMDPSVGLGHEATGAAFAMTVTTLYRRLADIEGISAEARKLIDQLTPSRAKSRRLRLAFSSPDASDFELRSELIGMLEAQESLAYSQTELGWMDLASLIAEHSFQEVFLRAYFVRHVFGTDTDALLDDARSIYEHHPFASLMESLRDDQRISEEASSRAMSIDLDTSEFQSLYLLWNFDSNPKAKALSNRVYRLFHDHTDASVNDLSRMVAIYPDHQEYYDRLRGVSVVHPMAQMGMIKHHWEDVKRNFDEWLVRGEKNPDLLVQIGLKYASEKRLDEAEEYLQRACELQPNFERYRALASVYKRMKDWDAWQATLETSLLQPTSGLEHDDVQQEIADHYCKRRQFKEALPFALGASESYSAAGLLCAAQCYEALQEWEKAEEYYRAASERYSRTWWYSFTRRTGQGDGESALQFATEVMKNFPRDNRSLDIPFYITLYSGDVDAAIRLIEKTWAADTEVLYNGLMYSMLLLEMKKADKALLVLREALRMVDQPGGDPKLVRSPSLRTLLRLIEADLAAKGSASFPPGEIERARRRYASGLNGVGYDYFIGRYYELNGKLAEARRSYIQCMSFPGQMTMIYRTLAGIRLQALGETPAVYRQALWTGKVAEP